ncbi:30S ribosomal protein S4e [Candidatus Woesearchaeota archaeon]|nr:30S ribosomal protein S4e [Candidatus Woesearchaeota archaeon]
MAHVKRIAAPKSWPIMRKERKYIIRQNPGPHSFDASIPVSVLLRSMLNATSTLRETKRVLHERKIKVNGIIRTSPKFPVGLFDVVSFGDESYRILLSRRGKLFVRPADKSAVRISKIVRKTAVGKKIQLTLSDGWNMLVEKSEHKVGDSVVMSLPGNEVKSTIPFAKGSLIFLTKGNHMGEVGRIKDILGSKIVYEVPEKGVFETKKENAFVVGKDKPVITLDEI